MRLVQDIANVIGVASEFVMIDRVIDTLAFVRVESGHGVATHWTVETVRGGNRMKKNSLRKW